MTRSALRAVQPDETLPPPERPEMSLRAASNAKAKRELGWRPRYASWRDFFGASLS
jgi:nucleoside-diphosphate-sugar epimerase